jgi:hypothetical protein
MTSPDNPIPILSADDFRQEVKEMLEAKGATYEVRCEAPRLCDHYRQALEDFEERVTDPFERAQILASVRISKLREIEELLDDPELGMSAEATMGSADLPPRPPALGEVLLVLFCPKKRARHLAGDLEEIFHQDIKSKGQWRAKLLYWAAVLRSIGPLLWVKLRRAGFIALVLEIGRRWSGLS